MRLTYYSFIELCMVIALENVTYMFNSLDRLRNICMSYIHVPIQQISFWNSYLLSQRTFVLFVDYDGVK